MIALVKKEIDSVTILGKRNKMIEWLAKRLHSMRPAKILCTRRTSYSKEQIKCLPDNSAKLPSSGLSADLVPLIYGSTRRFPSGLRLRKKTTTNPADWVNSAELHLALCWSDNFLHSFNERQPWARNFSLGCFLLSALVCFLSVWGCFHARRMRVPSCSALSSGTSIDHVVFILSSLPRKRSVSNGVFYFNSVFVWLVLLLWKSFLRQEKEFLLGF